MTTETPTDTPATDATPDKPAEPATPDKAVLTREQKLMIAVAKNEIKLDAAYEELHDEKRSVLSLTSQLKDAKERYKGVTSRIHELLYWRRELRKGRLPRQQELPLRDEEDEDDEEGLTPGEKADAAAPVAAPDPADSAPLSALQEFGLTEKQVETLADSQLAKEVSLKTVGDLFRAIAADEWWFKKIKGFGDTKRDALINATIAYREKFPVPDGDTRQRQCQDCDALYPQTGTECPQCGSKFFSLTTPEEAAKPDPNPEEQPIPAPAA